MKLGPWVQRLEAGMGQLRHAMKAQDRSKILDGIDDVSFWTGRVVCDVLGAAEHSPVDTALVERAGRAVLEGQRLVMQAKSQVRGSRSVQRTGEACEGPFFHTTTFDRLGQISVYGLRPMRQSRFGGWYAGHSHGRVFLSQGVHEAGEWYDKVSMVVENNAELEVDPYEVYPQRSSGPKVFGQEPAWTADRQVFEQRLPLVLPVMLRIDTRGLTLRQDTAGTRDVGCSFYTNDPVGPERIEFYDGGTHRWRPIREWRDSDPLVGFREYGIEADEGEDLRPWITFTLREPWDDEPGAFAPPRFDEEAHVR
jgi:hypothetical protein